MSERNPAYVRTARRAISGAPLPPVPRSHVRPRKVARERASARVWDEIARAAMSYGPRFRIRFAARRATRSASAEGVAVCLKRHVGSTSTHGNLRYANASTTRNGSFVGFTMRSGANIPRCLCTHVWCTANEHTRAARTRLPHKRHSADEYAATVRVESLTCGAMRSSYVYHRVSLIAAEPQLEWRCADCAG
jgi:hypothetical protein